MHYRTISNMGSHFEVFESERFMHPSMLSPRVGGGGYPREFDSESLPLSGDFDISRCPRVGNLTCQSSWKSERTWK